MVRGRSDQISRRVGYRRAIGIPLIISTMNENFGLMTPAEQNIVINAYYAVESMNTRKLRSLSLDPARYGQTGATMVRGAHCDVGGGTRRRELSNHARRMQKKPRPLPPALKSVADGSIISQRVH